MEDWQEMVDTCHKYKIKLIQDLVVNHCSSEVRLYISSTLSVFSLSVFPHYVQHPWFIESRSSLDNPKRSWFHWKKGTVSESGEKLPPNNWRSVFGSGSAWEYDETTDEWYLHLFVKEQPDFNWENEEVREAVYDLMKFWLDKGLVT